MRRSLFGWRRRRKNCASRLPVSIVFASWNRPSDGYDTGVSELRAACAGSLNPRTTNSPALLVFLAAATLTYSRHGVLDAHPGVFHP